MFSSKSFHHIADIVHTSHFSHCFGWEVGMASSSIPILEEFRFKWNWNIKIFCHPLKYVSCYPEWISNLDAFTWSNLELPLARHYLSIWSRDLDSSIEACFVVSVHDSSTITVISSHWAIVWSLRSWETCRWPSKRLDSELVLLF